MKKIGLLFLCFCFLLACKKDTQLNTTHGTEKGALKGYVQKGPFTNGTAVTITELDSALAQTGKTYSSTIWDNTGLFNIPGVAFKSQYISLRADGFYFNEVTGAESVSQITLYALSDITNKKSININILSHVEKPRVEYLIAQGVPFAAAKQQAEREILKVFSIVKNSFGEAETLNIAEAGDDNAVLLAVSLIFQGYRTEGQLTQLLADFSSDMRTDGVLSDSTIGTQFINDAKYLNLSAIRTNLVNKYAALGSTVTIPAFEPYVQQFIDSTHFVFTNYITYPQTGTYGVNVLNKTDSVFTAGPGHYYSMAANLPMGTSLKLLYPPNNAFGVALFSGGWFYAGKDSLTGNSIFTTTKTGLIDGQVLSDTIRMTILFYENNSPTVTRTKTIRFQ